MHFKVAAEDKTNHRYSGVLVHPTSFPSPYGIGDMGRGAHEFIDFLAMAGQHLWQVLPLGPSGNGNSPYQSYSVFAGQTLLISPELLIEKKLLTEADVHPIPEFNADRVDYDKVTTYKTSLFKKAYEHFRHTADKNLLEEYDSFQSNNQYWLDDYCLYMAGKDYHNGLPWYEWEDSLLDPTPKERASWMKLLASEIDYYRFIQFAFFSQWYELKDYANKKGIAIIGFKTSGSPKITGSFTLKIPGRKLSFPRDFRRFDLHLNAMIKARETVLPVPPRKIIRLAKSCVAIYGLTASAAV